MKNIWQTLYQKTEEISSGKEISPFVKKGEYRCVLRTEENHFYVGTNITLEGSTMSAEKNAIMHMIHANDSKITHILLLNEIDEIISPCEDALYDLYALSAPNCVVLQNNKFETVLLEKLLPTWFGTYRNH